MKVRSFDLLHVQTLAADLLRVQRLVLAGSDGQERMALEASEDGDALLVVSDLHGRGRLLIGVDRNGSPQIGMAGRSGVPQIVVTLDRDRPLITFADADGNPRWSLLLDETGAPVHFAGKTVPCPSEPDATQEPDASQ